MYSGLKRCVLIIIMSLIYILILAWTIYVGPGHCDEVKTHYDNYGRKTGETVVKGKNETHYDNYGRKTGETVVKGKSEVHYDNYGRKTGETVRRSEDEAIESNNH